MVFALLFNQHDQLLAATPASIHQVAPDCYWSELYAQPLEFDSNCQTAYVPISDPVLAGQLGSLEASNEELFSCRNIISEMMAG